MNTPPIAPTISYKTYIGTLEGIWLEKYCHQRGKKNSQTFLPRQPSPSPALTTDLSKTFYIVPLVSLLIIVKINLLGM